jgi:hypothetical protein
MTKTLVLVIVALVVLVSAAHPVAEVLKAATPLVTVVGVLLLAFELVRYFTRP